MGQALTSARRGQSRPLTTSGLRDDLKHFGLGMYISELYCKKHDGFLTVENQSGGACVRAYFRSIVPESVVPETEAF